MKLLQTQTQLIKKLLNNTYYKFIMENQSFNSVESGTTNTGNMPKNSSKLNTILIVIAVIFAVTIVGIFLVLGLNNKNVSPISIKETPKESVSGKNTIDLKENTPTTKNNEVTTKADEKNNTPVDGKTIEKDISNIDSVLNEVSGNDFEEFDIQF